MVWDAVIMHDDIADPAVINALDAYHVWGDTSLLSELRRAGSDRAPGVNLCDCFAETSDGYLGRGMMGEGVADVKGVRKVAEDAGYLGY